MITSNVAKRYAKAFFDVAGQENRYEECYEELHRFARVVEENRQLKDLFSNPVFDKSDKKDIISKVLQTLNPSSLTANFIRLLVDKSRISCIVDIDEDYRILMYDAIGIARVQVKTAFPLRQDLSDNLKLALESLTGKKVEMHVAEDKSLLGGVVVRVGDKLYDGSIKVQLDNMTKLLGEEI